MTSHVIKIPMSCLSAGIDETIMYFVFDFNLAYNGNDYSYDYDIPILLLNREEEAHRPQYMRVNKTAYIKNDIIYILFQANGYKNIVLEELHKHYCPFDIAEIDYCNDINLIKEDISYEKIRLNNKDYGLDLEEINKLNDKVYTIEDVRKVADKNIEIIKQLRRELNIEIQDEYIYDYDKGIIYKSELYHNICDKFPYKILKNCSYFLYDDSIIFNPFKDIHFINGYRDDIPNPIQHYGKNIINSFMSNNKQKLRKDLEYIFETDNIT